MWSEMVSSPGSIGDSHRISLVEIQVISNERRKEDGIVTTTTGTWHIRIHLTIWNLPLGTLGLVTSWF
jgi:hypothetical protein